MNQVTARDFMVKRLVTLRPDMDVLNAVQMLLKNRISGAPVVDLVEYGTRCSASARLGRSRRAAGGSRPWLSDGTTT